MGIHTHTHTHTHTHVKTHSQIPRLSYIMHQIPSLGCTVVVVLAMISDFPAFFHMQQNTHSG